MRPGFYQRRWEPNLGLSRHTIYRVLYWLLVIFIAYRGFLFGKSMFDSFRATRLAAQAEMQVAAGAKDEAIENLKQALTLDDSNPRAARLMARLREAEDNPLAVEYYRLVAESGEASAEDFRLIALAAARYGNEDLAIEASKNHAKLGGDPAFPDLIAAQILALKGDSAGREKALRAALQHNESSETLSALADFLLADAELLDLNAAESAHLLRRAAEIDKGPKGLQALRKGLAAEILSPAERTVWLQLYRAHPAADTASRLDAAEIEWAANPSIRRSVLQKTKELFSSLSLAERVKAAQWFLNQGEPRAVLEILPCQQAASAPVAMRLWIEAAIALGDWNALEAALRKPLPALDDTVRLPLLARAIKQQGRAAEADALNAETLQRFQSNPAQLSEVLSGILAAGEWDLFKKNLTPVVSDPKVASSAIRAWVPVARDQRSSARLLGFYEKALASPVLAKDPYLLDRLQFCRLMLGIPVPIEDVEARLPLASGNPNYFATAALGYLKNGRKAKALHLLEGGEKPVDLSKMTPSRLAAVAAVFAANDRASEARQIAARIPRQKLTVEEEAFLELALEKGGVTY
jgi:lipopolysaccharide biosynthesis regulator YciM